MCMAVCWGAYTPKRRRETKETYTYTYNPLSLSEVSFSVLLVKLKVTRGRAHV